MSATGRKLSVKRIVANLALADSDQLRAQQRAFYGDLLGLDLAMDLGWIQTFTAEAVMTPQLSVMAEGGSGTDVPELSIEVDDLDEALARMRGAGVAISYGPAMEPWGVRRFYVRDPAGHLVNVLQHA